MRFIHPDILDRFRELVPSWPWATFPTPPRMICEVSDAVTWCGNYVSLFAERQQPESLAEARSWHRVMIDRVMLLKSVGYHKDRKRAIKRALKELVPRIDFLNAQMTLLNAAYPAQWTQSPDPGTSHFMVATRYAIASIKYTA